MGVLCVGGLGGGNTILLVLVIYHYVLKYNFYIQKYYLETLHNYLICIFFIKDKKILNILLYFTNYGLFVNGSSHRNKDFLNRRFSFIGHVPWQKLFSINICRPPLFDYSMLRRKTSRQRRYLIGFKWKKQLIINKTGFFI